jgi:hypothetical protein
MNTIKNVAGLRTECSNFMTCLCSVLQRRDSKILFSVTASFLMCTRFIVLTGTVLIYFAVTALISELRSLYRPGVAAVPIASQTK